MIWTAFIRGGPLMWPLLFCSFIGLTVIIERFWFWRKYERQDAGRAKKMPAGVSVEEEYEEMIRRLPVLDSVVTVAPLLGILGTVTGIIKSFDLLGAAGLKDPSGVTAGIAEALITTAAGLIVAIPAVIAFNYFNHRASRKAKELEKRLERSGRSSA